MSFRYIKRTVSLDGALLPEPLVGSLFTGENQAHCFMISCTREFEDFPMAGGTITGEFINANQETVPLNGSVVDGVALLVLSPGCYAVKGRFTLTIYCTLDGATCAIYQCKGSMDYSGTGTIYDPDDVIPNLPELLAELEDMRAAKQAALDAAAAANQAAAKSVRYDVDESGSKTSAEKARARNNIGAVAVSISGDTVIVTA